MNNPRIWVLMLITAWWLMPLSIDAPSVNAASGSGMAIRVAIFPYVTTGSWPVGIAQEKGFLLQEGLKVTITETYQQIAGLVGGHFDIIITSIEPAMLSLAKGERVVVVGFMQSQPSQIFVVEPNVQSAKELSGKTIGVWKIPSGDMFLCEQLLLRESINANSVKFLQVGGSRERLAAITAGRIHAATFDIPHSIMARKQGMRWLNNQRYWEPMAWSSIIVKDDWAKKNSELVERFVRASYRGIDWLNEPSNAEEAAQIMARLSKFEKSLVDDSIKVAREDGEYVRGRPSPTLVKVHHEMLLKQGFLEKPLDLGSFVDASYYDRGLKRVR